MTSHQNVWQKSWTWEKKLSTFTLIWHWTRLKLGDSSLKIRLVHNYDTVRRWTRRFESGKGDVRDKPRSELSKTKNKTKKATNEKAIELARAYCSRWPTHTHMSQFFFGRHEPKSERFTQVHPTKQHMAGVQKSAFPKFSQTRRYICQVNKAYKCLMFT